MAAMGAAVRRRDRLPRARRRSCVPGVTRMCPTALLRRALDVQLRQRRHAGARARALVSTAQPASGEKRVLNLADAEGKHDVSDAADDGDSGHPGNEENSAATVVAGRPEADQKLED